MTVVECCLLKILNCFHVPLIRVIIQTFLSTETLFVIRIVGGAFFFISLLKYGKIVKVQLVEKVLQLNERVDIT